INNKKKLLIKNAKSRNKTVNSRNLNNRLEKNF
ncbi:unnamed protein product, partial [marine sediment metagenome]